MKIMKIIYLGLLYSLFTVTSWGQIAFQQVAPLPPAPANIANFDGATNSSLAFADIDNDNDQDVLITGWNYYYLCFAKLYNNDGNGNYTEVAGTPFDGVYLSSIAFADIDNDNDQDVLITGENNSNQRIAKLYTNDGDGNFTEVTGTPFEGLRTSSIAFADIDNDNDQDVLITGENSSDQRIAKLYTNDGNGNFSEVTGTPFDGVRSGSIAFADIDNDNDQDVLITGENSSDEKIAKLYTNNGSGNYTEVTGIPFDGVRYSFIDFADIDNDNDQDVLITGDNGSPSAKLYTNSGSGNFSEVTGTPFDGVSGGSVAFADIDNDNDQDVLITGHDGGNSIAKLYTNDGMGSFIEVTETPFTGIFHSSIAFADIDNDNDQDVLLVGINAYFNQLPAKLYINDGNGKFALVTGSPFDGVSDSSAAFADIDNDNDQDVLITGYNSSFQRTSELYSNDGNGNFIIISETPFDGVSGSSIAFADIDNDSDEDVLITGQNSSYQPITKLYTNNGSGIFSEVSGTTFESVKNSAIAFKDIDNDNDQDLLITGENSSSQPIAKLYSNDGNGNFSEVTGTSFNGVKDGSIAFADIDNDNDPDVLITGDNGSPSVKLYTNNGSGIFSEVTGTPFEGVTGGSIAFADIDNDNDLDVLITGYQSSFPSFKSIAKLYMNDGNGNFTEVTGTPFEGVNGSSIAIADFDNDNDKDIIITGYNGIRPTAKLFTNDGSGVFSEADDILFTEVSGGSIAVCDIDNDSDQDVMITGQNSSKYNIAHLYRNISCSSTTGTDIQTACGSFTWIDGITYTSSNNTATFTLTNSTGCDSIVTLNLTINAIDVTVTTTGSSITANETGASYQWINCSNNNASIAGESSQSFTAAENGDYAVIVTKNGCTDTSACITISTVGIEENALFNNVSVFPNPNQGWVNINLGNLKEVSIKVFNTSGNLLYSRENIIDSIHQFELNETPGIYFIEISYQGEKHQYKLVLK